MPLKLPGNDPITGLFPKIFTKRGSGIPHEPVPVIIPMISFATPGSTPCVSISPAIATNKVQKTFSPARSVEDLRSSKTPVFSCLASDDARHSPDSGLMTFIIPERIDCRIRVRRHHPADQSRQEYTTIIVCHFDNSDDIFIARNGPSSMIRSPVRWLVRYQFSALMMKRPCLN